MSFENEKLRENLIGFKLFYYKFKLEFQCIYLRVKSIHKNQYDFLIEPCCLKLDQAKVKLCFWRTLK